MHAKGGKGGGFPSARPFPLFYSRWIWRQARWIGCRRTWWRFCSVVCRVWTRGLLAQTGRTCGEKIRKYARLDSSSREATTSTHHPRDLRRRAGRGRDVERANYVTLFVSRFRERETGPPPFLEGRRTHPSSAIGSWGEAVRRLESRRPRGRGTDRRGSRHARYKVENGRAPSPRALFRRGIDRRVNKKASDPTRRGDPRVPDVTADSGSASPASLFPSSPSYSLAEQRAVALTREQCRRETALGMLSRVWGAGERVRIVRDAWRSQGSTYLVIAGRTDFRAMTYSRRPSRERGLSTNRIWPRADDVGAGALTADQLISGGTVTFLSDERAPLFGILKIVRSPD